VIGQAPVVGTTVFDMTSDGATFQVSIPSKKKFLVGAGPPSGRAASPSRICGRSTCWDALLWAEIAKKKQ